MGHGKRPWNSFRNYEVLPVTYTPSPMTLLWCFAHHPLPDFCAILSTNESKEGNMEPKDVRLQGLFQTYGKTIILPYDQGLEHGPRDFFNARYAEDPLHIIEIAKK